MKRCVVLSSGGLDSSTCLALAVEKFGRENVTALNIFYGQSNSKEIQSSANVCNFFGVEREELCVDSCFKGNTSALIHGNENNLKNSTYEEQLVRGSLNSNVPFRNGLFLSAATCMFAGRWDEDIEIYLGNNKSDCYLDGYPDCTPKFIEHMNAALDIATCGRVRIVCPLQDLSKEEIAKLAVSKSVPIELTWSCYRSGDKPCGVCASCRLRESALSTAKKNK